MDIRESTQLTKKRKPLKLAEVLESSKKQFIRTMQKDIESLQKGQPAKPSMPVAGQVKKAAPPAELPVVEPAKRPVLPPFPSPRLKSAEGLGQETEIKKGIEETQKRLEEERRRAEMARQKTEREKAEERGIDAKKAEPVPPEPVIPKLPTLPKPIPPKPVSLKKELPLEKEVKPAIKKSYLKFVFVGLAGILIIGGIGGFLYWWNYLRVIPPVATYYECQDLQCVSVEGEGEDQCLNDEDCQPVEPVEPTIPDSLIQVDETRTIGLTIEQKNLLPGDLKLVAVQEQTLNTFKRILVKLVSQTEKKYADLDTLISALGISLPDNIFSVVGTSDVEGGNYTLFLYNQSEGNRLGVVINMRESATLVENLKSWEQTIITDLGTLLLKDEIPIPFTEEFQDNVHQDIAIRYLNFPIPDLSIDYAVVAGKLVITTSRESMYATIDALLIAQIDTSDWQTYRNEEYGYEIEYPEDWTTDESYEKVVSFYKIDASRDFYGNPIPLLSINIENNPQQLLVDQWIEQNKKDIPILSDKESIMVDGVQGVKFVEGGMVDYLSVYVGKGTVVYGISTFNKPDDVEILNQILSTFKFIE